MIHVPYDDNPVLNRLTYESKSRLPYDDNLVLYRLTYESRNKKKQDKELKILAMLERENSG